MLAKLSVYGLYSYDSTIFDPLTLPGNLSKDDFIALVIQECSELPTTYPNPETFKTMIGAWSNRHQNAWAKMYAALTADYNPIENYNRYEDMTDQRSGTSTSSADNTATAHSTAYNSDTFKATDKTESGGNASAANSENLSHTSHIHGNIGVTTSAQMIKGELEIRHTTIYQEILADFMDVFTIGVY